MENHRSDRTNTVVLSAMLLALWLIVLWRAPLHESLWLDETISYWIGAAGFREALQRSWEYQAESAAYFVLLAAWQKLFGITEIVLRLPSIAAVVLASLLLVTIGKRLRSTEYGLVAALFFVGYDPVLKAAFSARPYALALLMALLSTAALLWWLAQGGVLRAAVYAACTLAAIYLHYLFAGILAVHLAFFWAQRNERKVPAKSFGICLTAVLVLLLPALPKILHVAARPEQLSFAASPGALQLAATLCPPYLLIYLACAAAMAFVYKSCRVNLELFRQKQSGLPLLCWWALAPLLFAAHAWLSGNSYFLSRLFLWHAGGLALCAALCVASFTPSRARLLAAVTLFVLIAGREASRQWQVEDWRGVAAAAREAQARGLPVLVYSGLVESEHLPWLLDPARRPYLLAPFTYYPVSQPPLALPPAFDRPAAEAYYKEQIAPAVDPAGRFLLAALQMRPKPPSRYRYVHQQLTDFFSERGFTLKEIPGGGLVRLFEGERQPGHPEP